MIHKIILISVIGIFSNLAHASSIVLWSDIQENSTFTNSFDFSIPIKNANESFIVKKNTKLSIKSISFLDEIKVVQFVAQLKNCSIPNSESEVELIEIRQSNQENPVVAGVSLNKNCRLEFYIEASDFYKESLFLE